MTDTQQGRIQDFFCGGGELKCCPPSTTDPPYPPPRIEPVQLGLRIIYQRILICLSYFLFYFIYFLFYFIYFLFYFIYFLFILFIFYLFFILFYLFLIHFIYFILFISAGGKVSAVLPFGYALVTQRVHCSEYRLYIGSKGAVIIIYRYFTGKLGEFYFIIDVREDIIVIGNFF